MDMVTVTNPAVAKTAHGLFLSSTHDDKAPVV